MIELRFVKKSLLIQNIDRVQNLIVEVIMSQLYMHVHGKASDFHPTSQILHFFYKIGKIHVTKKKHFL